jgi:hypothetical protein
MPSDQFLDLIFDHDAKYGLEVPAAIRSMSIIDICINNAIIGVQEQNTYAQTEGERRPARRSA